MKPISMVLPYYTLCIMIERGRRERLVREAIDSQRRAPADVRRRFEQKLDSLLRVPGFKHASKAPVGKLLPEVLRYLYWSPAVLEALLDLWVETRPELRETVATYLSGEDVTLGDVFALERGSVKGWAPEMSEVISTLNTQMPEEDADEIALMVCCVADPSQIRSLDEGALACPGDGAEAGAAESPEVAAGDPFAYELGERFGTWLRELEALPPEAPEWDEAEMFIEALLRAASERLSQREAARDNLARDLAAFVEKHAAALRSFGHAGFERWTAEHCPRGDEAMLAGHLEKLGEALGRYEETCARGASGRVEERERRAALDALEGEIEGALAVLDSKLTPHDDGDASPEPPPKRDPESDEQEAVESGEVSAHEAATTAATSPTETAGDAAPPQMFDDAAPVDAEVSRAEATREQDSQQLAEAESESESEAVQLPHKAPASNGHEPDPSAERLTKSAAPVVTVVGDDNSAATTELPPDAADEAAPEQTDAHEAVDTQPVYAFRPEQPSPEIAAETLRLTGAERRAALRDLVWRLVYEGRYGLASHFAGLLELEAEGGEAHLPAWVPRSIALGLHVRHANGDLARTLREDFANFGDGCFVGGGSEWNHGLRFLCAAAAMRPALLAPETGAAGVLRDLHTGQGLDAFYECCKGIAEYSDLRHPLDPNALKHVRDATAWQAEMNSLRERVREWSGRARKMQMKKFSRATQVWRKWQESGSLIHRLLRPVVEGDASQLDAARQEVERLSVDAEIRREINYTDRQVLRRLVGDDIMAAAFVYLRDHLREAVGLVREWIALQEVHPARERSFIQQQAEALSLQMRGSREGVRAELEAFARQHPSFYVQAGVAACRAAFEDLWTLFDSATPVSYDEPPARHLLHAELLKASALRLSPHWEPEAGEQATLDALLRLVGAGEVGWCASFEAHAEARNHEATGRIVEYLERHPDDSADAEQLRQAREAAIAECRDALEGDAADARKEVQGAVASGLLREQEQLQKAADIESALADGEATSRFDESRRRLRAIREEIKLKREAELTRVRERLAESGLAPDSPAYARISAVLRRGDAATANEYIDRTLNQDQLPDDEQAEGVFTRFFPQAHRAIADFMEPPTGAARPDWQRVFGELREHARGGRRLAAIGPVDLGRVFGKQAERAAEMLEAWLAVKRARTIDRVKAKQILTHLGFGVTEEGVTISGTQSGGRAWLTFEAEPIRDRERCPLPSYGSNAGGRYRVLCIWDRPAEEELLNLVGDTSHGAPVLVFYFARMVELWRRNLARLCRQRRRTFAVIDDTLLLYLCGEPEPRMRPMFECALPFTHAEPYTTTAGLVPVEMFYGREQERRSLTDPMGSCFIYGGRQLGKTALLRDVERRFGAQPGKVALWFDLKTHGIGLDKNIDDVWGLLAAELGRAGVVPSTTSRQMTLDRFLEHVQSWLAGDDERHLLLLLDEADDFLSYDGRTVQSGQGRDGGFVRVERLKGLMEKTHRRFKVVFSGLHNVQRTTRLANHPLAHYGQPLQIGPLLDGGEWREARALIERPLAALGYVFQTPDLVMRILWRTNYYPSLIQLYCHHLHKHLTDAGAAAGFNPQQSPPYVITSRHVDDVYYSRDLRKAIRDRLIWTLQLDQRYEVIAYAIASHSLTESVRSMVEGLPVSWVRDEALYWWPEGFSESASEDSIRTLLDEMVGLGILRVVDSNHYTLRSSNVVALMGTADEIVAALLRDREVPLQYEPAKFRAALRIGGTHDEAAAQRSPLTAQQESELRARAHGASVVFGCTAAGLDDVAARMAAVFGSEFFINLDGTTDRTSFERRMAELVEREKGGNTLVLVPTSCPWGLPWVEAALQRLKRLTSKKNFVHVLFTAGPRRTWQLVGEEAAAFEALTAEGLAAFSLRPWDDAAVRQWLDESRFPANDPHTRARIREMTGNWPLLLYRFHEAVRSNMQAWERGLAELCEASDDPAQAQDLAAAWGLDAPEPRRILHDLHNLDWESDKEPAGLIEDLQPEVIEGRLRWARRLGIVTPRADGRWQVEAVVGRILSAVRD